MPKPSPLEKERFTFLLWRLDLLNTEAAQLLGVSERTVYNWLAGTSKIHPSALKLLELTLSLRPPAAKV